MREQVIKAICQYDMIKSGGAVLAAVSGGRDSMALLHVLHSMQNERGFCLYAIHINHGLRENAIGEQQLVLDYCQRLCVPLQTVTLSVREQRQRSESVEMAARRLRYAAFLRALDGFPKGTVLATAHHQKDQAETVLMRLMRGSGTRGLAGIHPVRGAYIRPMLFVPDEDIQSYVLANAIPYRIDESNFDDSFVRNRIRHELLPQLENQYNPNLQRALGTTAKAAYEDELYLRSLAAAQKEALGCRRIPGFAVWMQREGFLALPAPIQKRVLRLALEELSIYHMEEHTLLAALAAIKNGGTAQLSKNAFVRGGHFMQAYVALAPNKERVMLPARGACFFGPFSVEVGPLDEKTAEQGIRTAFLSEMAIHEPLWMRTRRPGDSIAYACGHKKLSDAMADNRIPFCVRDQLPVILCGDELVWSPGLRVADAFVPAGQETKVLQILVKNIAYDGGIEDE